MRLAAPTAQDIAGLLAGWLPTQRWFAGKDRPVDAVRLLSDTPLPIEQPRVHHLVVGVEQGGHHTAYQVPLSLHEHPQERLEHVRVGELWEPGDASPRHAYDALHDKDATAVLLTALATKADIETLRFHVEEGALLPLGQPSMVLTVEQSNTSLVYGEAAVLKVFRRVAAGLNPDIEVHDALTRAGSPYVAALLGWVDGSWTDADTGRPVSGSLAMLQRFLRTATDGWALATTSVRDLYAEADLHADEVGGDFAGEARRLGAATAEVHAVMHRTLPHAQLGAAELSRLATGMRQRLDAAAELVPDLRPYAAGLGTAYDGVAELDRPVPGQRVHGDLHLGQVVRTVLGWRLLDFEGEPEKPLAERVVLDSPLRDVAGMLRSFDYAAHSLYVSDHPDDPQIAYRASEWADRNRAAFCAGYASVAARDPREEALLLRAYETDKAVYETVYEWRHRPGWLGIPLAALERLAGVSSR